MPGANFRREIVRCPKRCFGEVAATFKHFGDSKVTKFYNAVAGHEHVLTFDVAVQNFLRVDMLYGEAQLAEPVHYLLVGVSMKKKRDKLWVLRGDSWRLWLP